MKSTVILMVALMAAASVQAHGTSNIRGEAVKPFTGEISDEVAVERLRSLGFQDVRVQSRQDKSILLEATQAGAPVQLRVNRTDGVVTDAALQRRVIEPLPSAKHPRIEGAQVPVSDSLPLRPMAPGL